MLRLTLIPDIYSFYKESKEKFLDNQPNLFQEPKRKIFHSYSIYLTNTIFHNDEETIKLRTLSVTERAFIWEKYKNYGNKYFHKGNYRKALFYYERVAKILIIWIFHIYIYILGIKLFQMVGIAFFREKCDSSGYKRL